MGGLIVDKTYNINGAPMPTAKRRVDMDGADFYPTPTWATEALLKVETFKGSIWEPACGDGAMAEVLKSAGYIVHASDLYDRGYGIPYVDFLSNITAQDFNNVVTNPPFHSALNFTQRALHLIKDKKQAKVCMLLRLAFLEGKERKEKLFDTSPPSRVWVFSKRVTFYPSGAEVKGSGTTPYAWFVWESGSSDAGKLGWI